MSQFDIFITENIENAVIGRKRIQVKDWFIIIATKSKYIKHVVIIVDVSVEVGMVCYIRNQRVNHRVCAERRVILTMLHHLSYSYSL